MHEGRTAKLAEFSIPGDVTKSLLAALTGEHAEALRKELGPRGFVSSESAQLKECRDHYACPQSPRAMKVLRIDSEATCNSTL